ncbi:unnamed protein product, partial [Notodromas monacha]
MARNSARVAKLVECLLTGSLRTPSKMHVYVFGVVHAALDTPAVRKKLKIARVEACLRSWHTIYN